MATLSKAPVCFTLAQLKFNPMLDMKPLVPSLQESFGKSGFPDFEESQTSGFKIKQGPTGISVDQNVATRYSFRNAAKTACVLLDAGALTFELTEYPDFERFFDTFLSAVSIVHEHRPIKFYDRVGMRMLDAIQPGPAESIEHYVVPEALGFPSLLNDAGHHIRSLTESVFRNGHHTLVVKTMRARDGVHIPPDLGPLRLELTSRFTDHKGDVVMLDSDAYMEKRQTNFDLSIIGQELATLKAALKKSFESVATEHAMKAWA